MSRSSGEITALLAKAASGAGAPPAQAASFGRAAAAYLLAGHDPDVLTRAMQDLPDGPIISLPLTLDRAAEGADRRVEATREAPTALLRAYLETSAFDATLDPSGKIMIDPTRPNPRRPVGRITLDPPVLSDWSALAARGLVPETDWSRRAGAGAGLTDND